MERAHEPAARWAPGIPPWGGALAVPKLGGKLPPRTARLAVPPGFICRVPGKNGPEGTIGEGIPLGGRRLLR